MIKTSRKGDFWILVIVLMISLLGLTMVYSSSWPREIGEFNSGGSGLFKNQARSFVIGLIGMWIFANKINYRILKGNIAELSVVVSLILNIIVKFISEPINGAYRWIELPLGFSFMPSDLMKISFIILTAKYLSMPKKFKKNSFLGGFIPIIIAMGIPFGILLLIQSDLGTAGTLGITMFAMYLVSGVRLIYPLLIGIIGVVMSGLMVVITPYRFKRLITFLDPFKDTQNQGWQVVQSLYAIGSGGLFGVGLGQSKQKYYYLPFAHSDFIFAIFAEEFGLIGSIILIGLYLAFALRGIRVALLVEDSFGKLLAFGISFIIFIQAMIHIGVASSAIPTTGITMPLFSHGGTSLIVTLVQVGVLLNISKNIDKKEKKEITKKQIKNKI